MNVPKPPLRPRPTRFQSTKHYTLQFKNPWMTARGARTFILHPSSFILPFLVAIAAGFHPFPFRTRPLSPPAPTILGA